MEIKYFGDFEFEKENRNSEIKCKFQCKYLRTCKLIAINIKVNVQIYYMFLGMCSQIKNSTSLK